MSATNNVQLIGNIGSVEPLRDARGTPVLNFSLATETWRKDREPKTEWHRCAIFGARAETMAKLLEKGKKIAIQGSISYRTIETVDGRKTTYTTIVVQDIAFPCPRPTEKQYGGARHTERNWSPPAQQPVPARRGDDGIPF